jgi:hypothetical protein
MVYWWVLVNSGHVLDLQLPVITDILGFHASLMDCADHVSAKKAEAILSQNQGFFSQIPQVGALARIPSFNSH